MAGLDSMGTVVAVDGTRVVVSVGGVRMRVDGARVVPAEEGERGGRTGKADGERGTRHAKTPRATGWSGVAPDPATELDLRGQRADEAELALCRALDDASVADLREMRVIHGKGTGALRKRVSAVLESDRRVEEFRAGTPAEGGYGVTVVRLR